VALSDPVVVAADPQVNYDWQGKSPLSGVPATNWSARWAADLEAPVTGRLSLVVRSDDGVRLWWGETLVLDRWVDQAATSRTVTVEVVAGRTYPVRLEYYQRRGASSLQVRWMAANLPLALVPPTAWFLPQDAAPVVVAAPQVVGTQPLTGTTATVNFDVRDPLGQGIQVAWQQRAGPVPLMVTTGPGSATVTATAAGTYRLQGTAISTRGLRTILPPLDLTFASQATVAQVTP